MTPPDQIKTIAADFLRALATAPGLFARWQAETSPSVRAEIVRTELGLAQTLTASDVTRMAAFAEPHAVRAANSSVFPDVPVSIVLAHDILPPTSIVLAHANIQGAPA
jgi:hypothetical protein